ncbi:hypothetical protein ACWEKM_45835 [Streptomyces sp. NPDC004752]
MPTYEEVEALAARLRFDLESAGFAVQPPEQENPAEGGLLIDLDRDRVHVAWTTHERLGDAALDAPETGAADRHQMVRAAMHLALASILTVFGYPTLTKGVGFGYAILPDAR